MNIKKMQIYATILTLSLAAYCCLANTNVHASLNAFAEQKEGERTATAKAYKRRKIKGRRASVLDLLYTDGYEARIGQARDRKDADKKAAKDTTKANPKQRSSSTNKKIEKGGKLSGKQGDDDDLESPEDFGFYGLQQKQTKTSEPKSTNHQGSSDDNPPVSLSSSSRDTSEGSSTIKSYYSSKTNASTKISTRSSKKQKKTKGSEWSKSNKLSHKKSKRSSEKSPTVSPSPTRAPSMVEPPDNSTYARHLAAYALEYTVTEGDRIPFRSELLEVVELTRVYLLGFFEDEYENEEGMNLKEFLTIFIDAGSDFGVPIYIAYNSSAIFSPSSIIIPSKINLDNTLESAFQGQNLNGYLSMLQALPPSNLFSTTFSVQRTQVREKSQSSILKEKRQRSKDKYGSNAIAGVVAGVAGLTLLAATGLYHRKNMEDAQSGLRLESSNNNSVLVKSHCVDEIATVSTTCAHSRGSVVLQLLRGGDETPFDER